ncbi:unnamed protein product [Larinioides sclopetarius]|uniref:Limulus clotting factor C n=1 Tax=Larinioides sclopetarius TaxID=280406 RepID=A0AAV2A0F1_9ARAC
MSILFEITLASLVISSLSALSPRCISCLCGSSNQNYTHCIEESVLKDFTCERWSYCQTCKSNTTSCITCPPGRIGTTCSEILDEHTRRKRQDDPDLLNHPNYPRRSGSCPFLERPESGSIRCSQTGNERYCTSRCLPGYRFEGEENVSEITLRCRRGIWTPRSSFPPCVSGGHCEVQVTGAGFYNCTIDMDGTHCDITCDGWYRGRFHCYPGRSWNPPLPFCTVPKEPASCRCENGGVCNVDGICTCPEGRTGTYCENLERQKATCPDPGIPRDGSRLNSDGSDASYRRVFEEGESVIFTCNGENSALQGKSLITCLEDGTWSAPLPRCITSRVGGPTIYCPDPGYVQFGSRVNADGSNSRPSSRYRNGESVVYYCIEGYELVGNSILTCLQSGQWSSSKPFCRRNNFRPTEARDPPSETTCRHPGVDINGIIEDHPLLDPRVRGQTFPPGTELTFACKEGFEPEGAVILSCMSFGEWSSAPPTCKRSVATTTERPTSPGICRHPGVDVNGRIEDDSRPDPQRRRFPVGTELKFACNAGFELEGATTITCRSNGQWTSLPPKCRNAGAIIDDSSQLCSLPEVNPNVEVEELFGLDPRKHQSFEPGDKLTFSCKEGNDLEGPSVVECLGNGRWSSPPPTCNPESRDSNTHSDDVPQWCPTPEVDPNGEVVEWLLDSRKLRQSFEPGTELTFRCKEGYVLQGWEIIRCSNNGQWSNTSPKCNVRRQPNCGRVLISTTDRVTFGTETLVGEWPWTVAIAQVENGQESDIICGGALIDTRTVLTAAHCLTDAENFIMFFGKYNRSVEHDDQEVKVGRSYQLTPHPNFNEENFDNDIAIVKFQPDVQYSERIQPVCLPTQESTERNVISGRKGYLTGWGINENRLQSDKLMMAHLPVQSEETCLEAYQKRNLPVNLNAGKFCAGYPHGSTSACEGDSGSPLVFYERETDRHILEGIVSFGMAGDCSDPEKYTVFAKVSNFMEWILQNW